LNFLDRFSKNTQIPNLNKIRPVGAELFHADGWADMTKLTVALNNFANAPKKKKSPFARFEVLKVVELKMSSVPGCLAVSNGKVTDVSRERSVSIFRVKHGSCHGSGG
jgi:hypothetical protein